MAHSTRFRHDLPNDAFVLNAKLALKLAGDGTPMVANIQADRGRFNFRQKSGGSLLGSLSKASGWARIPELCVVLVSIILFIHFVTLQRRLSSGQENEET